MDDWYLQAYITARFLLKSHSKLSFRMFCQRIRGGMPIDKALWRTYRYSKAEDFDKALIRSLKGDSEQDKFEVGDFSPRRLAPSKFKSGFDK